MMTQEEMEMKISKFSMADAATHSSYTPDELVILDQTASRIHAAGYGAGWQIDGMYSYELASHLIDARRIFLKGKK